MAALRWIFGDQLGPHFTGDHRGPVLLVESRRVLARRRFHRAKAHLVLSAMRHRARELGDKATYVRTDGGYAGAVRDHAGSAPVEVVHPTSYAALGLVRRLAADLDLTVLDPRGFATPREDF
jgi:deoxyribodipyrimidine photolyase-related protein